MMRRTSEGENGMEKGDKEVEEDESRRRLRRWLGGYPTGEEERRGRR